MKGRRLLIWEDSISNVVLNKGLIGGIGVQLYHWTQTFIAKGWDVYAISRDGKFEKNGIHFIKHRHHQHIQIVLDWILILYNLLRLRPKLVIFRGAYRTTLPLAVLSNLCRIKFVLFAASDVNFVPGKEQIGGEYNKKLFRKSIKHIKYIVSQNEYQFNTLKSNYNKDSLIMHNIWKTPDNEVPSKHTDVIWVANFRPLKRPEWVFRLAEQTPELKYVMIGGPGGDGPYYNLCKEISSRISNLIFMGPLSLDEVDKEIKKSRILICTSEFEGFPNTFLQAWSNKLPVISTVDPSGIINENHLGTIVKNEGELKEAVYGILNDDALRKHMIDSITVYYKNHFDAYHSYNKLMNYLEIQV